MGVGDHVIGGGRLRQGVQHAGLVTLANTVTTGGRPSSHDVAVNGASGRLYRAGGGGSPVLGLRIYDLADPSLPVFLGEWNDRYCHDVQVVSWTEAPYAGVDYLLTTGDIENLRNVNVAVGAMYRF